MRRFQTLRGRLTAISVLVAFVAVVGLTIAFNVLLQRELDRDARTRLRAEAGAAAATLTYSNGRLTARRTVEDTALEHNIWVFDMRGRAVQRPPAGRQLQRGAVALIGSDGAYATLPENVRLYSSAVTVHGRRVGTVVAGQSRAAYDRTLDVALGGSLAFAAGLLGALSILTWMTIGRALDPVREMTQSAAQWSENDLDRRFGTTPRPDELGALAATFDGLLDRVAASLRHEQRLSAELSHELRTPLARIIAEVELLQRRERSPEDRREAYEGIAHSAEQMSGILETLMATARADAKLDHGRAEMSATLDALCSSWEPVLRQRDVALEVREPAPGMYAGVHPEVVERIVAPLLENAGRYARSRVTVDAERLDGRVVVTVADDGPGVPQDARESVFEPGVRAGPDIEHSGAGLGLPLSRRLARAAGGDVTVVEPRSLHGAELRVDLPA